MGVATASIYSAALWYLVNRYLVIYPRSKSKQEFFSALKEGLRTSSIETLDDVVNIYKGVAGLGSEELDYRYGLSGQLREFLVAVVSKKGNDSLDDKAIIDWKKKISEFIKKNEEISPYEDLPASERSILNDISAYLEKDDRESVGRKMVELSGMIKARNYDLMRIRNVNKFAIPLSVIGVVLTVIFGILALS